MEHNTVNASTSGWRLFYPVRPNGTFCSGGSLYRDSLTSGMVTPKIKKKRSLARLVPRN